MWEECPITQHLVHTWVYTSTGKKGGKAQLTAGIFADKFLGGNIAGSCSVSCQPVPPGPFPPGHCPTVHSSLGTAPLPPNLWLVVTATRSTGVPEAVVGWGVISCQGMGAEHGYHGSANLVPGCSEGWQLPQGPGAGS